MANNLEKLITPDQVLANYRTRRSILFAVLFAMLVILAALLLKSIFGAIAINRGMGNRSVAEPLTVLSLILSGLVLVAPAWSAMFLVLTPFSIGARLTAAGAWLFTFMAALVVGNQLTYFARETSMQLFSGAIFVAVPMLFCGWCAAFGILPLFARWQIHFPQFAETESRKKVSIQSFLIATIIAAVALGSLQKGNQLSLTVGIGGVILAAGLGLISLPLIAGLIRSRNFILVWISSSLIVFAIACPIAIFSAGSMHLAIGISLGLSAFVLALSMPIIAARIGGAHILD